MKTVSESSIQGLEEISYQSQMKNGIFSFSLSVCAFYEVYVQSWSFIQQIFTGPQLLNTTDTAKKKYKNPSTKVVYIPVGRNRQSTNNKNMYCVGLQSVLQRKVKQEKARLGSGRNCHLKNGWSKKTSLRR